jgi:hypothetical protein
LKKTVTFPIDDLTPATFFLQIFCLQASIHLQCFSNLKPEIVSFSFFKIYYDHVAYEYPLPHIAESKEGCSMLGPCVGGEWFL